MTDPRVALRILGPVELEGRGIGFDPSVVRQPKRLAVLAYLALETVNGYRRRDHIVALFWPDVEQAKARTYLRKTIHSLRAALGEDLLEMRGDDELRVSKAALSCDAVELLASCRSGRWSEALALYRGDFLVGMFVEGVSPEFEEWLDAQRRLLRRSVAAAAWGASRAAAASGQVADAIAFAQRGRELDPEDEEGVRLLIDFLDRRGDRGTALKVYSDWQRWLEREYGVEPAPETRRLANRVRAARKGDSHEAAPTRLGESAVLAEQRDARRDLAPPPHRRPWQTLGVNALLLAGGVAIGVLTARNAPLTVGAVSPQPTNVNVEALLVLGPDSIVALASVLNASLVGELAADARLSVRETGFVSTLARNNGRDLPRSAKNGFIVAGALITSGDVSRLNIRVLRAEDAAVLWAGSYDLTPDSLNRVLDRVVQDLGTVLFAGK